MNFKPPRIYAITDTRISGISHEAQISRLAAGGIKLIQLRDKQASPRNFYESAKKAISVARKYDVKVIINDRVDIALAAAADGVHLGQDDLSPECARMILGPHAVIGYSTHSLEQARLAVDLPVNYIAIGPVFETRTKGDADALVGLETLAAVKREIGQLPVIAIGGINSENIQTVFAAGADSVALISALVANTDRIAETAEALIYQADSLG